MSSLPLPAFKRAFQVISVVTTTLLLGQMLSGCSESKATETKQPYYHLAQSENLNKQNGYQVNRTFIGQVQVKQNAQIGFEQSGKVAELYVNEGEHVKKGQLLAQQDIELLTIERQELDAQLRENNADLSLVDANLKRLRSLKKRGFTSDQSLDELQAQRKVLIAARQRLHASISGNKLRIDKAALHAPFDAVVGERLIDDGEVVSAGAPALTLLQQGLSEIKVGVPVDMLGEISTDKQFEVKVGKQQYPVKLLTKGSDVNPTTRTVQLRFALISDNQLVNGQLAYLTLQQNIFEEGYWVPLTALTDGQRGMWNIFALADTDENAVYQLQSHNVQVLYTTAEQAYISAPLSEQQRILTAGLHRLVPGQKVVIGEQVSLRESN